MPGASPKRKRPRPAADAPLTGLAAVAAKQAMPAMPQRHRPQRNARHGQARAAQLRQAFLNEAPVADEDGTDKDVEEERGRHPIASPEDELPLVEEQADEPHAYGAERGSDPRDVPGVGVSWWLVGGVVVRAGGRGSSRSSSRW